MKTYKREFAVLMIVWLIYIVETKDVTIIETLVWPVFTFVTAAFGLDQYSKLQQRPSGSNGGNQRSGQHPSRQDEYPNDWDNK